MSALIGAGNWAVSASHLLQQVHAPASKAAHALYPTCCCKKGSTCSLSYLLLQARQHVLFILLAAASKAARALYPTCCCKQGSMCSLCYLLLQARQHVPLILLAAANKAACALYATCCCKKGSTCSSSYLLLQARQHVLFMLLAAASKAAHMHPLPTFKLIISGYLLCHDPDCINKNQRAGGADGSAIDGKRAGAEGGKGSKLEVSTLSRGVVRGSALESKREAREGGGSK